MAHKKEKKIYNDERSILAIEDLNIGKEEISRKRGGIEFHNFCTLLKKKPQAALEETEYWRRIKGPLLERPCRLPSSKSPAKRGSQ